MKQFHLARIDPFENTYEKVDQILDTALIDLENYK